MNKSRKNITQRSDDSIIREMFVNQSKNMKELYAKLFETSNIKKQITEKKLCI